LFHTRRSIVPDQTLTDPPWQCLPGNGEEREEEKRWREREEMERFCRFIKNRLIKFEFFKKKLKKLK
jgi:hypothetical protein